MGFSPGQLIRDRYELVAVAGSGGEAAVWQAWDHQHDRTVALKIRPALDSERRRVLLAEARMLLRITPHPGLPLVRDDFFVGDDYLMVMDWVQGRNLRAVLEAEGDPGLDADVVLEALGAVSVSLDHLHGHDPPVVHGDVKPSNIIVTADGRTVLVDYGIAHALGSATGAGSAGFRAPEAGAALSVGPSADVYGLAATAFVLLTGRSLADGLPSWDGFGDAGQRIEAAIRAGLATDPRRRPATARAFLDLLREALGRRRAVSVDATVTPGNANEHLELPWTLNRGGGFDFAGRTIATTQLETAWHHARGSLRQLVVIQGEAGIGKSRLVAEFAETVLDSHGLVLAGRCDKALTVPYQPVAEALEYWVEHTPPHELAVSLGRHPGDLARLVPLLGRRLPDLPPPIEADGETERYRLMAAVASWLETAARRTPLLLIVEDLHWASEATCTMLRLIIDRLPKDTPILIAITVRHTDVAHPSHVASLLSDLAPLETVRLTLGPLTDDEVCELANEALAERADGGTIEALAHRIARQTAGNPLYVQEVLRGLDTSNLDQDPDDVVLASEGVRDAIDRRLGALPATTVEVLEWAAVAGADFSVPDLVAASGTPAATVASAVGVAEDAGLVASAARGRFRFTHALVRDVIHHSLGAVRAASMHAGLGEALAARGARSSEVANHFLRAVPVAGFDPAITHVERAAHDALEARAYHDAASVLDRLWQAVDHRSLPADRRRELMLLYGTAQNRAGIPAHRETLLECCRLAADAGDTARLIAGTVANSRGLWSAYGLVDEERVTHLEAALEVAVTAEDRARVLAILAAELVFAEPERAERRFGHADEALELARSSGERNLLLDVLQFRSFSIWCPDTLDDRLSCTAELLELLGDEPNPNRQFFANFFRSVPAMEAGLVDEAMSVNQRAHDIAREARQPTLEFFSKVLVSANAFLSGDYDEAAQIIEQGLEMGLEHGQPDAPAYHAAQVAALNVYRGDPAPTIPAVEAIAAIAPSWQCGVAVLAAIAGDHDLARDRIQRVLDGEFVVRREPAQDALYAWLGEAAAISGTDAQVAGARALLEPLSGRISHPAVTTWGAIDRVLGSLASRAGDEAEAERLLQDSLALHSSAGWPPFVAMSNLDLARHYERVGQDDRARVHAAQACAEAARLGMAWVESEAAAIARP